MIARRGERRDPATWTLVLVATAVLALPSAIGLVSPRSRSAAEPPSEKNATAEREPPPSPLAAPRPPRADDCTSPARVPSAKESAWRAEDAGHEPSALRPASVNHAPELAVLEIRVTRSGRAEAGAAIELVHQPSAAAPGSSPAPALHLCDEQGALRLELAPGTVRAVAWSADACALPASATLAALAPARLELELEPAFPVAGRVLDARTGAPIAGATVALWTFSERDIVTTGPDGSFRHPRFPARAPSQQIAARASGYGAAARYLRVAEDGSWKLPACTVSEGTVKGTGTPWVELALVPELRVRGSLVDERGQPLAAAQVSVEGFYHVLPSVAARDFAVAASDARGGFELGGLRSDVGHSLLVEAAGFAHELVELDLDASETGAAALDLGTLVLARETVLAGAVIDADGQPLAGVEVVLHSSGATPNARNALDVAARIQGRELRATTSAEGTFQFEHLAPRPVTIALENASGVRTALELLPRPDGSFESPCLTLAPVSVALAELQR
jgi:protocatechuate 3,4-dioxygenase beta subunit